ncbi:hypothetical protein Tco_0466373 [Tanacetum coccineum]
MVAYLVKSEGSEGFHEIIDFLTSSHIYYALTECPARYISLIEQFWQIAALSTTEDRVHAITATIDGRDKIITEPSIRRHLKLQDSEGLSSLPNAEIFKQLARMGFIQILLNKQQRLLLPHTRTYSTPTLTNKLFNNMRRASKGYSGVVTPLFDNMLVQPQDEALSTSPSRITSSPSLSSHHTTSSTPTTPPSIQTTHETEETTTMPHDLPLLRGHIPGSDEGRLKHDELMELVTKLSDRVVAVEEDLMQTKKNYTTDLTKLVLKVKKLEKQVRSGKARRRARIVLLEEEDDAEDPSKQGRKIAQIDTYPTISLVQDEGTLWFQEDVETQEKNSADIEVLLEEETPTELIEDLGSGEKGEKEISTANVPVSTVGAEVSPASHDVSTTIAALVYIRRSASKDKGKAIMQEPEPPKKLNKRVQVQISVDKELARKVQEEEQAKAMAEQEQERINFEAALELQRQLNEKEEVPAEATQSQTIDWSDPAMLRYHALQNRPYSVAEVRKNMIMYLKNQAGYKQKDKEKDSEKKRSRKKSLARKRAGEKQSEESIKRQKIKDDVEKEELKAYLDLVPREEVGIEIESLATKYPIVDWKTRVLTENFMYYQIFMADGSFKNYKIFSEMLNDFDR